MKTIIDDFSAAGIIKPIIDGETNEYYFSKGMYCFDPVRIEKSTVIKNYYEYLSNGLIQQKWNIIFNRTRITKFHHRLNSIKVEIMGVALLEYEIFFMYMKTLFFIYTQKCKLIKIGCTIKDLSKKEIIARWDGSLVPCGMYCCCIF